MLGHVTTLDQYYCPRRNYVMLCAIETFSWHMQPTNVRSHDGSSANFWIWRVKCTLEFLHVADAPILNSICIRLGVDICLLPQPFTSNALTS